jgi:rod shape-determining protein MreB
MGLFTRQLAIDFGTSTTRICIRGRGVVLQEPTVLAHDPNTEQTLAAGRLAQELVGRSSERAEAVTPLTHGVIADFDSAQELLRTFIIQATGRFHLTQPDAMITIPSGATSTEQRALVDVGGAVGLKNVYLIPGSVAAALGSNLPIIEPRGQMVINIGAGVTEIAVLSLGGVVAQRSLRAGGNSLTELVARAIKRDFGINVGMATAEEVKRIIGTLDPKQKAVMRVRGRGHGKNAASEVKLKAQQLRPAFEIGLEKVVMGTRSVLEKTPPDLVADISERGIVLSGGGAYLNGLAGYLSDKLQVKVELAQDPLLTCAKGALMALTNLSDYKRSLLGL